MAGIAELRLRFPQEETADKSMRQMTAVAPIFFYRCMDIPLLEGVPHFRMTIQTFFCRGLFHLLAGLDTGNRQQKRQQAQKKHP